MLSQEAQVTSNKPTVVKMCWCLLVSNCASIQARYVQDILFVLKAFFSSASLSSYSNISCIRLLFLSPCKSSAWVCTFFSVILACFSTSHAKSTIQLLLICFCFLQVSPQYSSIEMTVELISLILVFHINWLFFQIFPKLLWAALTLPNLTLMSLSTLRDLLNLTFDVYRYQKLLHVRSTFIVIKSLLQVEIYRTNKPLTIV